jgi:hypothetical protein
MAFVCQRKKSASQRNQRTGNSLDAHCAASCVGKNDSSPDEDSFAALESKAAKSIFRTSAGCQRLGFFKRARLLFATRWLAKHLSQLHTQKDA